MEKQQQQHQGNEFTAEHQHEDGKDKGVESSAAGPAAAADPGHPSSSSSSASSATFLIFVYGTLKRGQPNADVMVHESTGRATLIGTGVTADKWPLVIASRYNVPYLLNKPGTGHVRSPFFGSSVTQPGSGD